MIEIFLSQSLNLIERFNIGMKAILKGDYPMEKDMRNIQMAVNTEDSLKTEKKVDMENIFGLMGLNTKETLPKI